MGPLLRDRILLLQFICTTGALCPGIVLVQDDAAVRERLFDLHDSGSDLS